MISLTAGMCLADLFGLLFGLCVAFAQHKSHLQQDVENMSCTFFTGTARRSV